MAIRHFSKQERRGLIGIFVLLISIVGFIVWQDKSSKLSNQELDNEADLFYKEIQLLHENSDEQFDSLSKMQKNISKKSRKKKSAKKKNKEYPQRNPIEQPISTK